MKLQYLDILLWKKKQIKKQNKTFATVTKLSRKLVRKFDESRQADFMITTEMSDFIFANTTMQAFRLSSYLTL